MAVGAMGVLARRLVGVTRSFLVRVSARAAGSGFLELFERAQAHYLALGCRGWTDPREGAGAG